MNNLLRNITTPYRRNKSRTIRSAFAFPLVFTMVALLGAAVIDSQNQSYIHIEASKEIVTAGESFKVDVYVFAHIPVNAVDISLSFPSSQVEVTGIDTGQSVITLWTTEPYIENNAVVLRGGTFRKGFLDDHLIATVNVKAKTSGLATFSIDNVVLLAGDGSGSVVKVAESGKESIKLYVANKDGTFIVGDQGVGLEGTVNIRIVTDIDGDGTVSLNDLSRFMSAWASRTTVFDFSGDGRMTFKDFGIILSDTFFK